MFYVYGPSRPKDVSTLAEKLNGGVLKKFDGLDFWYKGKRVGPRTNANDVIVCWGSHVPEIEGVRVLNYGQTLYKFQKMLLFQRAGLQVPYICTYKMDGRFIPRTYGGSFTGDMEITDKKKADYWVLKEPIEEEYVIHSFFGKSIRAGKRQLITGFKKPSTWIRKDCMGWETKYDGFKSTDTMRAMAHAAVKAVGWTFGVVTLGKKSNGEFVMLDCESAPDLLDKGTLDAYVGAIQRWANLKDIPTIDAPGFLEDLGNEEIMHEDEDEPDDLDQDDDPPIIDHHEEDEAFEPFVYHPAF